VLEKVDHDGDSRYENGQRAERGYLGELLERLKQAKRKY
jgi:hypothetical protein